MFCVIDLETTGLSREKDFILEIGAVLVDRELEEQNKFHRVCRWSGDPQQLDQTVIDMHTKNGLFDECIKSKTSFSRSLLDFEVWCDDNLPTGQDVYLTGNNIKFDIGFLEAAEFEFAGFHYRSVDISSIKILCNEWAPEVNHMYNKPVAQKLHRSIPDCYDSLAELNYYKDMLWTPKSVPQDKC